MAKEKITTKIENVYGTETKAYQSFMIVVSDWNNHKKHNAPKTRDLLCKVGGEIDGLYIKGIKAKLNTQQVVKLVKRYFGQEMTSALRSKLRALHHDRYDIEAFALANDSASTQPHYLVQNWQTKTNEMRVNNKVAISKRNSPEIAVDSETGEAETVVNRTQNRVIGSQITKSGIEPDQPTKVMSTQELCLKTNFLVNQTVESHNSDKLSKEQNADLVRLYKNAVKVLESPPVKRSDLPTNPEDTVLAFVQELKKTA